MEKPCSSFSSSISLGALTLRRFKILEEFTWQLRSAHYHNKENVYTTTSAPPVSQFLTDTLVGSKDPIRAAQIVMGELFMSTVTHNRFLLSWSVLTRYLFFCWRAIKYLSSASSAVEAGLSPWHVLPSFRNTSTDAHNTQSGRCTWAAQTEDRLSRHTVAQVFTFNYRQLFRCISKNWSSSNCTLHATWTNTTSGTGPECSRQFWELVIPNMN